MTLRSPSLPLYYGNYNSFYIHKLEKVTKNMLVLVSKFQYKKMLTDSLRSENEEDSIILKFNFGYFIYYFKFKHIYDVIICNS